MVELIGLLMMEHRLIEQITGVLEVEIQHISHDNVAHPAFIYSAVDFFRTYADRFHHGKEEDILFHELAKKPLTPIHRLAMGELMEEHRYARKTVGELVSATDKWSDGDFESLTVIYDSLRRLCQLYPEHIRKEDKEFFISCQQYFSKGERENLLEAGYSFDKGFTTKIYQEKMRSMLEHER